MHPTQVWAPELCSGAGARNKLQQLCYNYSARTVADSLSHGPKP